MPSFLLLVRVWLPQHERLMLLLVRVWLPQHERLMLLLRSVTFSMPACTSSQGSLSPSIKSSTPWFVAVAGAATSAGGLLRSCQAEIFCFVEREARTERCGSESYSQ